MTDIIRDIHRDLIMMNLLKQQYLTMKSSLLKQATLMLPQFFSQISKILTISLGLLKVSQKDTLLMVSIWFGDNKSVTPAVFLERLISDILFIKEKKCVYVNFEISPLWCSAFNYSKGVDISWCTLTLKTCLMLWFLDVSWKLHKLAIIYWGNEWWICLDLQKGPSKWTKYYSSWTTTSCHWLPNWLS